MSDQIALERALAEGEPPRPWPSDAIESVGEAILSAWRDALARSPELARFALALESPSLLAKLDAARIPAAIPAEVVDRIESSLAGEGSAYAHPDDVEHLLELYQLSFIFITKLHHDIYIEFIKCFPDIEHIFQLKTVYFFHQLSFTIKLYHEIYI